MKPDAVSDKTYTINGQTYDRVTSVIDSTLGGQSVEAAACEVAKHASELFLAHRNGETLAKPSWIWNGREFIESFQELAPSECLSDAKSLQGHYYKVRQGWLDRGTVLNQWFDSLAQGTDPSPGNAIEYVNQIFEEGKPLPGSTSPIAWACDRDDVVGRAMWLARFFREVKPCISHVQQLVVSEKLMVAGTLDALGVYDGKPTVWELKCGSEQFSHQVQASTYKVLAAGSKKWNVVALYIKPDGYRLVKFTDDQVRSGFKVFKNALSAYRVASVRRNWKTVSQNSDTRMKSA